LRDFAMKLMQAAVNKSCGTLVPDGRRTE